jgi:hypothetical protein
MKRTTSSTGITSDSRYTLDGSEKILGDLSFSLPGIAIGKGDARAFRYITHLGQAAREGVGGEYTQRADIAVFKLVKPCPGARGLLEPPRPLPGAWLPCFSTGMRSPT